MNFRWLFLKIVHMIVSRQSSMDVESNAFTLPLRFEDLGCPDLPSLCNYLLGERLKDSRISILIGL